MGIEPEITAHYELGVERGRLTTWGRLKAERTRELLDRHLPPPLRAAGVGERTITPPGLSRPAAP